MDKLTQTPTQKWDEAIKRIQACPEDTRTHFALLILQLADCYGDDHTAKAVILIDRASTMAVFSAGADESDAVTMVRAAAEVLVEVVTAEAPPREMFN